MGKGECCGLNCVKNVLYILNIIFLLVGFSVLTVAVWTIFDTYQYFSLLSKYYPFIIYFLLVAGCLGVISPFMGCYAGYKENRFILLIYIFALVLIFLVGAMVAVLAFTYKENFQNELNLNQTFLTYYKINEEHTRGVDFVQQSFHCCGSENFTHWKYSVWLQQEGKLTENKVPDSCCKSMSEGCGRRDHPSNIYHDGCMDLMANDLKCRLGILIVAGLVIFLTQIFGIIFAIKLYLKLETNVRDSGEKCDLMAK